MVSLFKAMSHVAVVKLYYSFIALNDCSIVLLINISFGIEKVSLLVIITITTIF